MNEVIICRIFLAETTRITTLPGFDGGFWAFMAALLVAKSPREGFVC